MERALPGGMGRRGAASWNMVTVWYVEGPKGGAQVALVGLALAKECNRLGRPEQAICELDKLLSNKVADAELYCERALAHNKTHQLANNLGNLNYRPRNDHFWGSEL